MATRPKFDPEMPYPVIDRLPEQKEITDLGGTMRLVVERAKIHPGTRTRAVRRVAYERHRHGYEVNIFLRKRFEPAG